MTPACKPGWDVVPLGSYSPRQSTCTTSPRCQCGWPSRKVSSVWRWFPSSRVNTWARPSRGHALRPSPRCTIQSLQRGSGGREGRPTNAWVQSANRPGRVHGRSAPEPIRGLGLHPLWEACQPSGSPGESLHDIARRQVGAGACVVETRAGR